MKEGVVLILSSKGFAQIRLLLVAIVVVAVSILTLFISGLVMDEFNTAFQDSELVTDEAKEVSSQGVSNLDDIENIIMFVWLGVWIGGLVMSWFMTGHPALFVITIILLVFLSMFPLFLDYVVGTILEDSSFDSVRDKFNVINFFLNNLFTYYLFMVGSFGLVFLLRSRGGGLR